MSSANAREQMPIEQMSFEAALRELESIVSRLEQVFEICDQKPAGKTCRAMQGIIEEAKEMMEQEGDPAVMDAALISSAQRVEHYEIASYGTLVTWARQMGHSEAEQLLQQTLDEEKAADRKLTELAESEVNVTAER